MFLFQKNVLCVSWSIKENQTKPSEWVNKQNKTFFRANDDIIYFCKCLIETKLDTLL